MKPIKLIFATLLCALLGAACGDRSGRFERGVSVLAPVAFDTKLLLIDNTNHEGHLLDVSQQNIASQTERFEVPLGVTQVVRREGDHDEVLLLTSGRQGSAAQTFEPALLIVMDDQGGQRKFELGNPFDRLQQSEDGRFAFLWRSGNAQRLLDADTQIALVDLDASTEDGVTVQALTNLGETPQRVVFSPAMEIAGETRRLAVVFGGRKLALLDLSHPGRRDTAVELTSDLTRLITPEQVVFDQREPRIFVRANGASDIYSLRLLGPFSNAGGNDFRPTVDLLDVGNRPGHMTLVERGDRQQLLVTDAARPQIDLVELDTGRTLTVTLPFQTGRAYVADVIDEDGSAVPTALMWSNLGNRVLFASLDELDARGDRALETSSVMPETVGSVLPMANDTRVVITHPTRGMSIVDLSTRTVTPLSSNTPLASATIDLARQRVWVAPEGQRAVAFLDLATGETQELLLDQSIQYFIPMLAAGRLAVTHASNIGHLTVLEADEPTRETAQSVRGFLLADLLD